MHDQSSRPPRRRHLPAAALAFLLIGWPLLSGGCPPDDGDAGSGASGLEGTDGDGERVAPPEDDELEVDFGLCSDDDCGPALGMPNWLCEDGTIGGPACEPLEDGTCGWVIYECPEDDGDDGGDDDGVCTDDECGPAPGMPNWLCEDGTIGGPACELLDDGTCGWVIYECPPDDDVCTEEECGPAMGMPNWLCPDGTVGGPACQLNEAGICGWVIVECP